MKWTYSLYVAALPLMAAPSFAQDRVRTTEPAPAEAAGGYLKIGDIKGESQGQANSEGWRIVARAPAPQAGGEHEVEYDIIKGAFTGNGPTFLRSNPDGDTAPTPTRKVTAGPPDTADKDHGKWILIESFEWGTAPDAAAHVRVIDGNAATAGRASGLATGRRQHRPVALAKPIDNAPGSLTLTGSFGGCAVGTKFSNITLKRGMMSYAMENAVVTSCSATTEREHISLNYEKITVSN